LSRAVDVIHALLSLVSNQSQATLEIVRQSTLLHSLQLGNCKGILELLRLVP